MNRYRLSMIHSLEKAGRKTYAGRGGLHEGAPGLTTERFDVGFTRVNVSVVLIRFANQDTAFTASRRNLLTIRPY